MMGWMMLTPGSMMGPASRPSHYPSSHAGFPWSMVDGCERTERRKPSISARFLDGYGHVWIRGWRTGRDSNPRYASTAYGGLANRWFQPLTHLSVMRHGNAVRRCARVGRLIRTHSEDETVLSIRSPSGRSPSAVRRLAGVAAIPRHAVKLPSRRHRSAIDRLLTLFVVNAHG